MVQRPNHSDFTMDGADRDCALDYGPHNLAQNSARLSDGYILTIAPEQGQCLAQQGIQQLPGSHVHSPERMTHAYQQHGMAAMSISQMAAQDVAYGVGQANMLPVSPWVSPVDPICGGPCYSLQTRLAYQQQLKQEQQTPIYKNSNEQFVYDSWEMHKVHALNTSKGDYAAFEKTPCNYSEPMLSPAYDQDSNLSPTHSSPSNIRISALADHHRRLPNRPVLPTFHYTNHGSVLEDVDERSSRSVVGQSGMPEPATTPKGPKLKFTPEDDALLIVLKETKNLTWKQIADFFPGRSSGTLQVRYCTKLKAKSTVWTKSMVSLFSLSGNKFGLLTLFLS
jgi:hypothetical protein